MTIDWHDPDAVAVTWAETPDGLGTVRALGRGFFPPDCPGIVGGVDIRMDMIPIRDTSQESRLA